MSQPSSKSCWLCQVSPHGLLHQRTCICHSGVCPCGNVGVAEGKKIWNFPRKAEPKSSESTPIYWLSSSFHVHFICCQAIHYWSPNHTDILRPNRLLPADAPSIHNKELYHAAAPMTAQCPGCLSSAPISVNASNATGIQRLQQKPEGLQQQAPKWITNIPRKTPMGWTIKTVGFCVSQTPPAGLELPLQPNGWFKSQLPLIISRSWTESCRSKPSVFRGWISNQYLNIQAHDSPPPCESCTFRCRMQRIAARAR